MKKILIILMSLSFIVGCDDSDDDNNMLDKQELSISATSILFDINGGVSAGSSNSITITSTADWELTGDDSWCNPSVNKGGNGTTVTFTATENNTGKDREVNLYFICGNATQKLTIKQLPETVVEFTKISDSYEVPLSGGRITIMVKTNLNIFDTEISEEWATIRAEKDEAETKWVQFLFDANTDSIFYDRTVNITMFKGSDYEKTFSVTQPKFIGVVVENPGPYEFGVAGGTTTVTATGNAGFRAITNTEDSQWIRAVETSSTGTDIMTKTFEITCVAGNWNRKGVITFTPTSGISASAIISQVDPNPELFDISDPKFATILAKFNYVTAKDGKYFLNYSGFSAPYLSLDDPAYATLSSLDGIERLENLTLLYVYDTNLRRVDLTRNTRLSEIIIEEAPLEVLTLGDINTTGLSIASFYNPYYPDKYAKSFSVSGSKLITLNLDSYAYSSLIQFDKLEWIDITGCPALTTVSANRLSEKLKTVYVTKTQKDAYDAGKLTITNQYNKMDIVVR